MTQAGSGTSIWLHNEIKHYFGTFQLTPATPKTGKDTNKMQARLIQPLAEAGSRQ